MHIFAAVVRGLKQMILRDDYPEEKPSVIFVQLESLKELVFCSDYTLWPWNLVHGLAIGFPYSTFDIFQGCDALLLIFVVAVVAGDWENAGALLAVLS